MYTGAILGLRGPYIFLLGVTCLLPNRGVAVVGVGHLVSEGSPRVRVVYLLSGLPLLAWSPGTRGKRAASVLRHLATGTGFCRESQRGLGPSVTAGGCFERDTANVTAQSCEDATSNHDVRLTCREGQPYKGVCTKLVESGTKQAISFSVRSLKSSILPLTVLALFIAQGI